MKERYQRQLDFMQQMIDQVNGMLAENERLITENETILKSHREDMELSRYETRVTKEDDEEFPERRHAGLTVIGGDDETGIITVRVDTPSLREPDDNFAYTSEEEPRVLRWASNQIPVPVHVCEAVGWPYMSEQREACSKEKWHEVTENG